MKPLGTLSTVHPNDRVTRVKPPLGPCDNCGWRAKRSPTARYCAPCKDEIDIEKERVTLIKLQSRRYPASKKDQRTRLTSSLVD